MRVAWKLLAIHLKALLRDANSVFWAFVFPTLLLLALCLIWGQGGTMELKVGLAGRSDTEIVTRLQRALRDNRLFKLFSGTEEGELAALRAGERNLVLACPPGDPARGAAPVILRAYYDPRQDVTAELALASVRQAVAQIDRELIRQPALVKVEGAPIRRLPTPKPGAGEKFIPAIIALMIIQTGLSAAIAIVSDRQKGSADIFRVPPVSTVSLVAANLSARVVIGGIQAVCIVLAGLLAFGVVVRGSGWVLALLIVLGTFAFTAIGVALAMLARNVEAANGMVTLVSLPLIFLSGLFFPIDAMPRFARSLALALPSSYLGDALRWSVTGASSIAPISLSIAILLAWTLACSLFAVRFFRWE